MGLNWYLLKTTGSMTRANTYVRRFTNGSQRSRDLNMVSKVPKRTDAPIRITDLDTMSYMSSSSRKAKITSGRPSKNAQDDDVVVVCPMQTSRKPIEEPAVRDSPQMREFFEEVRRRKLKDYYLQMKAAERNTSMSHICPDCGFVKRDKKDLSKNIYCTGDKRLRIKDCDRHGDLTWLWNSSAAYPHSALSCGCSRGVSSHLEILFKLHNIKCLI
ncbi:uncharacterized protein LOC6734750 [Drosophila simulans]|uniref:GD25548 n=1 Tax=Drosophila simulans TaxID=7240 RepID=B4QHW7_DROSI|nr:uncharacterized protein LOC6734750 [Drosophila simulans]EDX07338.1 GD25548 [Drosophila simulans]KMY94234.1 uncharacterized protein Dsimw501_GD25548 [Drosophila simulans]